MPARTPEAPRRNSCHEPSLGVEVDDSASVGGGVVCGVPVSASTLPLGEWVVVVSVEVVAVDSVELSDVVSCDEVVSETEPVSVVCSDEVVVSSEVVVSWDDVVSSVVVVSSDDVVVCSDDVVVDSELVVVVVSPVQLMVRMAFPLPRSPVNATAAEFGMPPSTKSDQEPPPFCCIAPASAPSIQ